jgi:biopolymer transport protein ExbB/TolQ
MTIHGIAVRSAEWKMQQAMKVVHRDLGRGLWSLATISSTAFLIAMIETLWRILASFGPIIGEKGALLQRLIFSIANALVPMLAGLALATAAWCAFRIISAKRDFLNGEMQIAIMDTLQVLARCTFNPRMPQ